MVTINRKVTINRTVTIRSRINIIRSLVDTIKTITTKSILLIIAYKMVTGIPTQIVIVMVTDIPTVIVTVIIDEKDNCLNL